ncbi:MAG: hypothetical protein ABIN94_05740 [Ferruginibacter sp.]
MPLKKTVKVKTLPLFDQRMLELMHFVISNNVKGINSKKAFFQSIGATSAANLVQIENGTRSFTNDNILAAKQFYGIDTNFLFEVKHLQIYPASKPISPIIQLKAATAMVSAELTLCKSS